ncbi:glycoside hydrolase family 76 protein [Aspergillus candidus]|uniref:Mannan endo-1,6-alpha-mannosidase n=1 Tax=Aspergillus candidus TaxID=41067 RepID=A0A2I2EZQ7_ASPCN|nr:glycosyl hydrolase [Aspergillus candidus]PLB33858.1 glycosyl hydrolase [Aspergillus candidus]
MKPSSLTWLPTLWLALWWSHLSAGLELEIQSDESLKKAASSAAWSMMSTYKANETDNPGKLEGTWWEAAGMFLHLIQYYHVTGDDTYNKDTTEGMQEQSGEDQDYRPKSELAWLGNDDQMFWGVAAITAAELKYPEDPKGASWLALAQAVFNTQKPAWDPAACGGGLRWQMHSVKPGYDLKNSISNGGLFQIAARLARYTSDDEYVEWANKIWDWSVSVPLINDETWYVADSTSTKDGCKSAGREQWTYTYGTYLIGSAYMYNHTKDEKWLKRVNGLLDATLDQFWPQKYFGYNPKGETLIEVGCEKPGNCDNNMKTYKGLLGSWLAFVARVVPTTRDRITPKLEGAARAAAKSCTGSKHNECGMRWYEDKYDGNGGMEQDMSALSMFTANLILRMDDDPVTSKTGGDSKSDKNAGMVNHDDDDKDKLKPITAGDKAGAAIVTFVMCGGSLALAGWVFWGEFF